MGYKILMDFRSVTEEIESLKKENEWILLPLYFSCYYNKGELEKYFQVLTSGLVDVDDVKIGINFLKSYTDQAGSATYILSKMNKDELINILNFVLKLDVSISKSVFNKNVLKIVDILENESKDIFRLPQGIVSIIEHFVLDSGDLIYFPYSGSLLLTPDKYGKVIYQDPNVLSSSLAYYKYCASVGNIENIHSEVSDLDPLRFWLIDESEAVSSIVSIPPMMKRLDHDEDVIDQSFKLKDVTQKIIYKGLKSLKDDGVLVMLIPNSFLFQSDRNSIAFKKYLLKNNFIDTVIQFPGGVLDASEVKIAIVQLKKNRSKEQIRLVNAEAYVNKIKVGYKLDSSTFLQDFFNDDIVDSVSVGVKEIADNDFNLQVDRYLLNESLEINNGFFLDEIVTFTSGAKHNYGIGKRITVKDLKNDPLDCKLDFSKLSDANLETGDRMIYGEGILVSKIGQSLKATYFKIDDKDIAFISHYIVVLKVKETAVIYPYFLTYELYSDYVVKQKKAYEKGTAFQNIEISDIKRIVVSIPSFEIQRAKTQQVLELASKFIQLNLEMEKLVSGKDLELKNEFASLKHSLGRPRQNILSHAEVLTAFFESEEEDVTRIKERFLKFFEYSLDSAFHEITDDINFISMLLEKGQKGLILEEYNLSLVPIKEISYFFKKFSVSNFDFKWEVSEILESDVSDEEILEESPEKESNAEHTELTINTNIDLLQVLLNNILENAQKHGYIEGEPMTVSASLDIMQDKLVITVANDGRNFPKGQTKESFKRKFSTSDESSGQGLGGYDLDRITKHLGGSWDLDLDPDDSISVKFIFQFPIKTIADV